MGADKDFCFSLLGFFNNLIFFLCTPEPVDVIHGDIKLFQPFTESFVVLEGQYGGRDQYRHLFAVEDGFESSPDGDFCLSESHITANHAVHRVFFFHVLFYFLGGLELVGSILIDERGFQFVLHVVVRSEGMPFAGPALSIEFDEFLGNVFDLTLGFAL